MIISELCRKSATLLHRDLAAVIKALFHAVVAASFPTEATFLEADESGRRIAGDSVRQIIATAAGYTRLGSATARALLHSTICCVQRSASSTRIFRFGRAATKKANFHRKKAELAN